MPFLSLNTSLPPLRRPNILPRTYPTHAHQHHLLSTPSTILPSSSFILLSFLVPLKSVQNSLQLYHPAPLIFLNSFFSFMIAFFTSFLSHLYLSQRWLSVTSRTLFLTSLNFLHVVFQITNNLSSSSDHHPSDLCNLHPIFVFPLH